MTGHVRGDVRKAAQERVCAEHGDALITEPGGPDMPTVHGRRYCPTCQELLFAVLDAQPSRVIATPEAIKQRLAAAWDEGYERAADTCPYGAPHHLAHGNPYRADEASDD